MASESGTATRTSSLVQGPEADIPPPSGREPKSWEEPTRYHQRKQLDQDKIDVDKFGSPPLYQIFPSILRMPCAKMWPVFWTCRLLW